MVNFNEIINTVKCVCYIIKNIYFFNLFLINRRLCQYVPSVTNVYDTIRI